MFEAVHTSEAAPLAIKVLLQDTNEVSAEVMREICALRAVKHPSVVELKDIVRWTSKDKTRSVVGIVMCLARGGDLFDFLEKQRPSGLKAVEVRTVMRQLVAAVGACHAQGVVHRDIKLENILLVTPGSLEHVVLTDFGLSKDVCPDHLHTTVLVDRCGSAKYAAPELMVQPQSEGYTGPPVDVWAMGVCMYTLRFGVYPFAAADERCLIFQRYENHVSQGKQDDPAIFPDWRFRRGGSRWRASADFWCLVQGMLHVDPTRRSTLESVGAGAWFAPRLRTRAPAAVPVIACPAQLTVAH